MKRTVLTILVGMVGTFGVLGAILGVMYLVDPGKDKAQALENKYSVNLNTRHEKVESSDNSSKTATSIEEETDNDNYEGNNNVTLYLFHGSTCQFCLNAKEYLKTIDYDYLTIKTIEVWGNSANSELLTKVREEFGDSVKDGVPYIVISDNYHRTGYNSDISSYIEEGIETAHKQDNYNDVVQKIIDENKDLEVVVEDFQN